MGENINVLAENVLTVKLSSDAAAASANWSKLNAALIMADGVNPITAENSGKWDISSKSDHFCPIQNDI